MPIWPQAAISSSPCGSWPIAVSSTGRKPNRASVIAMFIATPPGKRLIRPGTSEPCRIWQAERPITSQRTLPMHRISGGCGWVIPDF